MSPTSEVVTDGYYSVSELLSFALADLPRSPKGVYGRVHREKWPAIEVDGKGGKTGKLNLYKPPGNIQSLIEQRLRGELPPPPERPAAPARPLQPSGGQVQYKVSEGSPQPETPAGVDLALLRLCLGACVMVHGPAFAAEPASLQMEYASNFYNLLTRIAPTHPGGARSGIHAFMRLETGSLADQLRLLLQMRWLERYPPPDNGAWSW